MVVNIDFILRLQVQLRVEHPSYPSQEIQILRHEKGGVYDVQQEEILRKLVRRF